MNEPASAANRKRRYTKRIVIELVDTDYERLEAYSAKQRRTVQHQAATFVEDALTLAFNTTHPGVVHQRQPGREMPVPMPEGLVHPPGFSPYAAMYGDQAAIERGDVLNEIIMTDGPDEESS